MNNSHQYEIPLIDSNSQILDEFSTLGEEAKRLGTDHVYALEVMLLRQRAQLGPSSITEP